MASATGSHERVEGCERARARVRPYACTCVRTLAHACARVCCVRACVRVRARACVRASACAPVRARARAHARARARALVRVRARAYVCDGLSMRKRPTVLTCKRSNLLTKRRRWHSRKQHRARASSQRSLPPHRRAVSRTTRLLRSRVCDMSLHSDLYRATHMRILASCSSVLVLMSHHVLVFCCTRQGCVHVSP
eukprot:3029851-Pleurochrysis_carterae.AAC.1